jgi:mannose-1-phosphate guanylyltransferase
MTRDSALGHAYAVIMAGGSGTRFWPLSRRRRPKQLLTLLSKKTLLEETVDRLRGLLPPDRIFVYTSEFLKAACARCLRGIPRSHIIAEPAARNTAPTIGLAAHEIMRHDPDGIMIVLPADHIIRKVARFHRVLLAGCHWASVAGRSVTIGLKPESPETGYGYIQKGGRVAQLGGEEIFAVSRFTEKPPLKTARRYVASGGYLWNGGMFIWRAATLLRNLERAKPQMAKGLARISAAGGVRATHTLRRVFPRLERVSIDYAVMESISDCYVIEADMGWSDVGSWAVVYDLARKDRDGNARPRTSLTLDSQDNMIVAPRKTVVAVGVKNLVIVDTEDALLVADLRRSQDVGKAVQELDRLGRKDIL